MIYHIDGRDYTWTDVAALVRERDALTRERDGLRAALVATSEQGDTLKAERDELQTIIRLARERLWDADGRSSDTVAQVIRAVGAILRRANTDAQDAGWLSAVAAQFQREQFLREWIQHDLGVNPEHIDEALFKAGHTNYVPAYGAALLQAARAVLRFDAARQQWKTAVEALNGADNLQPPFPWDDEHRAMLEAETDEHAARVEAADAAEQAAEYDLSTAADALRAAGLDTSKGAP